MMNLYAYAEVRRLVSLCELFHPALVKEASEVKTQAWPEKINKGGWSVAGTRWQGKDHPEPPPVLAKMIALFPPELVYNAGYSVLEPGAEIASHVGYTDQVVRFHYGLVVPHGDCQIMIAGNHYHWYPGNALLFDDTVRHEAWNKTPRRRIILLADLRRSALR